MRNFSLTRLLDIQARHDCAVCKYPVVGQRQGSSRTSTVMVLTVVISGPGYRRWANEDYGYALCGNDSTLREKGRKVDPSFPHVSCEESGARIPDLLLSVSILRGLAIVTDDRDCLYVKDQILRSWVSGSLLPRHRSVQDSLMHLSVLFKVTSPDSSPSGSVLEG